MLAAGLRRGGTDIRACVNGTSLIINLANSVARVKRLKHCRLSPMGRNFLSWLSDPVKRAFGAVLVSIPSSRLLGVYFGQFELRK